MGDRIDGGVGRWILMGNKLMDSSWSDRWVNGWTKDRSIPRLMGRNSLSGGVP